MAVSPFGQNINGSPYLGTKREVCAQNLVVADPASRSRSEAELDLNSDYLNPPLSPAREHLSLHKAEVYGPYKPEMTLIEKAGISSDVATLSVDTSFCLGALASQTAHVALNTLGAVGGLGILAYGIYEACTDKSAEARADAACSVACGLETLGYVGQFMGKLSAYSGVLMGMGAIGGALQAGLGLNDLAHGIKNHNNTKIIAGAGNALAGAAWILSSTCIAAAVSGPACIALNLALVAYQGRGAIKNGVKKLLSYLPGQDDRKSQSASAKPQGTISAGLASPFVTPTLKGGSVDPHLTVASPQSRPLAVSKPLPKSTPLEFPPGTLLTGNSISPGRLGG